MLSTANAISWTQLVFRRFSCDPCHATHLCNVMRSCDLDVLGRDTLLQTECATISWSMQGSWITTHLLQWRLVEGRRRKRSVTYLPSSVMKRHDGMDPIL